MPIAQKDFDNTITSCNNKWLTFVKQKEFWLNEQGTCQGYTHTPSSTEFLGFHVLHLLGKTKTKQNLCGPSFGRVRIELVQSAVDSLLQLISKSQKMVIIFVRIKNLSVSIEEYFIYLSLNRNVITQREDDKKKRTKDKTLQLYKVYDTTIEFH